MRTSTLREQARAFSIETSYTDAAGKKQTATKDALAAAIRLRQAQIRERAIEPVTVVWGAAKPVVALDAGERVEWDLVLEDGAWRSGRTTAENGRVTIDTTLPPGYHSLHLHSGGQTRSTFVIAAPVKAYEHRAQTWGLFLPLYAAHSHKSWGAGDLGDLLQALQWVDRHGGSVVATLPMLAAFDDEPSPYSPVSRLFWNELYLDVPRLPEFRPEDVDESAIAYLRQTRETDQRAVLREKRRVLERCAGRWTPIDDPHTLDYARFRALHETGAPIPPAPCALPPAPSQKELYHRYVQYQMGRQLREAANAARRLGSGLYLDFPLGVNAGGYDAWRYANDFAQGASAGAPPDTFFTKGQNWGFRPFDPDAIRDSHYEYFRAAIRNHVTHAGVLRIDHVMGLHRLYWIPEGADAKDGVYVRYNAEELYAILTLESRRHACVIVGEDLGTVPPEVPRMMAKHGLRRMYVAQYELKPEPPPLAPPSRASVASVNTHDMPTFASFWKGGDVDDRVAQDLLDARGAREEHERREAMRRALMDALHEREHVLEALLLFLARSEAEIVLVNLEDLWGELVPQNVPGVPERSWRHKLRMSLEDAQADGSIRNVLARIGEIRAQGAGGRGQES